MTWTLLIQPAKQMPGQCSMLSQTDSEWKYLQSLWANMRYLFEITAQRAKCFRWGPKCGI